MKSNILFLIASIIFLFSSCESNQFTNDEAIATSEEANSNSSSTETDTTRQIIKTAQLKFNVKNLEESVKEISTSVQEVNGHISNYNIENYVNTEKQIQQSRDSAVLVKEIIPSGAMKIRVPKENAEVFISKMLALKGRIENFSFDETDVTEDKEKTMALNKLYNANTVDSKKSLKNKRYNIELSKEAIEEKISLAKMNHQINHLWFDVSIKANAFTVKENIAFSKETRVPFFVELENSLSGGLRLFEKILFGILHIWPLFLIIGGIVFLVLKLQKKQKQVSIMQ
ncbi:MAG: DUF4349 domain-containing protein [Chitinophagaceae bacterium]|nr:DUF4349 domain-containing protein [Chitinophagaceae bacterium]